MDEDIQDAFLDILTMIAGMDSLQTPTLVEILSVHQRSGGKSYPGQHGPAGIDP
ncbi:hypothetical protein RCO48_36260 [Peribacillus frigoritolerans]|nr:hypothetical protein [Peribacillus frigoritolerans]